MTSIANWKIGLFSFLASILLIFIWRLLYEFSLESISFQKTISDLENEIIGLNDTIMARQAPKLEIIFDTNNPNYDFIVIKDNFTEQFHESYRTFTYRLKIKNIGETSIANLKVKADGQGKTIFLTSRIDQKYLDSFDAGAEILVEFYTWDERTDDIEMDNTTWRIQASGDNARAVFKQFKIDLDNIPHIHEMSKYPQS